MKALEMFVLFLLHSFGLHFETSAHEKLHCFEAYVNSLEEGVVLANQIMAKARCLYMGEIGIHRSIYNGICEKENVIVSRRYNCWSDKWYSAISREWKDTEIEWERVELWISTEEMTFLIYFNVR